MKTPLNSKILILSLSALIVVGSGCERRGRAPAKPSASAPAPGAESGGVITDVASGDESAKKTPVKKSDSDAAEEQYISAAEMNCPVESIDLAGKVSVEDFSADLARLIAQRACLADHGIELTRKSEERPITWSLDTSLPSLENKCEGSKAFAELNRLAAVNGSEEDKASVKMTNRLELAILQHGNMAKKALIDARKAVGELKVRVDGVNLVEACQAKLEDAQDLE
jgi:hypothetical protein